MEKIALMFRETYDELVHKVTWPTMDELQNSAVVVLIATIIIALIIQGMDLTFSRILRDVLYKILLG